MKAIKNIAKKGLFMFVSFLFLSVSISAQSVEKDKTMGKNGFEEIKSTLGIYNDTAMTNFVNKVGQRLVSNLDGALFEYKFYIVPNGIPNAFALPGGYVFLTTGLIPMLENEDELACIISHEIIHSNNRHAIRQIRKRIIPELIQLPVEIVAAVVPLAEFVAEPFRTGNQLLFASYSRKFETEADDEGVKLAAKAGYDATSLTVVLSRMMGAIELITGETETKSYFSDHPYTPDRNKNLKKQTKDLIVENQPYITKEFLMEFDGVLYGDSPSKGIIRDHKYLHPDLNFYIEYPEDWTVENIDTAVAAYAPDKDAALILSIDNSKLSAKKAGMAFKNKLSENYKSIPASAEPFKVNQDEGYLISLEEVKYGDTTFAYVLWLKKGDNLFRMTALSNKQNRKTLLQIAESLRVLTPEERNTIKERVVSVVKAKKGETIKIISERTGNKLDEELTALINDQKVDSELEDGELIKIVVERSYK